MSKTNRHGSPGRRAVHKAALMAEGPRESNRAVASRERPRTSSGSARRQDHHHLAAFHHRLALDLGEFPHLGLHLVEEAHAEIGMGHLAAAEAHGQLDLVALLEEAAHGLHLGVVIVLVDAGAELDLLDLDRLLLLARFGLLLLLEEAEAPVIEDLAYRRDRVRRDLDEIEAGLLGD